LSKPLRDVHLAMKHTGNSVNVVALALHNLSILPLPSPGLTAQNAAYVAPRAAMGKERGRWPCFRRPDPSRARTALQGR